VSLPKYDAGRARERMAQELAFSPPFIHSRSRRRQERELRTLARVTGKTYEEVLADVLADVAAIQAEEEGTA
jgi:hypothetical protein